MKSSYPQENMGVTLLDVTYAKERRRVYVQNRMGYLEVGEFTRGPLTQKLYGWPVHLHCMHLPSNFPIEELQEFFLLGEPFLADYMDELDAKGVPYGYLNSVTSKYVSYRPPSREPKYELLAQNLSSNS